MELSSLEVTVDIAAYLRWGSLPCRVALELLRSMAIGVFFFSLLLRAGCSLERKKSRKQLAQMCCGYAGASGALPAMPWNAVNWLHTVVVVLVVARFPRNETG